jgi:flavin-dependent thymidylate synthase
MKIILAGYNVDVGNLSSLRSKKGLTPESISAAYARISRSSKSVTNLRQEAHREIEKARQSNRRIIFDMGHHSIAEHAVFNFDIIGISRRAVEEFERFRFGSYTEKSQRYVTLRGDFVIPKELREKSLKNSFLKTIRLQNDLYKELLTRLKTKNLKTHPDLALNKQSRLVLENLAKEDARYVLSLATQTQLGATINARNLELMLRRFASHPLLELNELGCRLFTTVKKIAPSIILFHQANDYDSKTYPGLKKYAKQFPVHDAALTRNSQNVSLIDHTGNGDDKILAAILFRVSNRPFRQCLAMVKKMSWRRKIDLFKKSCQYMELYDVVLREFEFAGFLFELTVSSACFGQLKRHRILSITNQDYNPGFGITIPESIREIGCEMVFVELMKKTEQTYDEIERRYPGLGAYILTNAHRKRVLVNVNLRELYHIARLREDLTAQWDIRDKARRMAELARRVMPITTLLLGGKDQYPDQYQRIFGKSPKVTETPLP